MEQSAGLVMPSFLYGSYSAVHRKTRQEGRRCGESYREGRSFSAPRELLDVPPGETVVAHEVVDFQREHPAWRLYMVSSVMGGLCEALDWQNASQVRDAYEVFSRATAWGSLYFLISQEAPRSAERMALRIEALLRFWEPLQSARYLFNSPGAALTLEELVMAARGWAMDAWCPAEEASVRARLELAAAKMARATKEDSIEAILREMPRALAHAHGLKHRALLAQPEFLRQRLLALEPGAFARVSGACTSDLLAQLHAWDRELA